METALFYRLEHHETKEGVYTTSNEEISEASREYLNLNRHPEPFSDELLGQQLRENGLFSFYDYIFGFKSVEQYRAWFYSNGILKKYKKNGVVLNLYATKDFFIGHSQMMAKKESLEFVKTLDILTFE